MQRLLIGLIVILVRVDSIEEGDCTFDEVLVCVACGECVIPTELDIFSSSSFNCYPRSP